MTFPNATRRFARIMNTLNEMLVDRAYTKISLPSDLATAYTTRPHELLKEHDVKIVLLAHNPQLLSSPTAESKRSEQPKDAAQEGKLVANVMILYDQGSTSVGIGKLREVAAILVAEPAFNQVKQMILIHDQNVTKQTRVNVKLKDETDLVKFHWQFMTSNSLTRNAREAANVQYRLMTEPEIVELERTKPHKRDGFPHISQSQDPVMAYYGFQKGQVICKTRFSEMAGTAQDVCFVSP